MPSDTDEPLKEASVTDEPLTVPSDTDEPLKESSVADEPLTVPSDTDEPLKGASDSDEPLKVPSVTDDPLTVPSDTDEPLKGASVTDSSFKPPKESSRIDSILKPLDHSVVDNNDDLKVFLMQELLQSLHHCAGFSILPVSTARLKPLFSSR